MCDDDSGHMVLLGAPSLERPALERRALEWALWGGGVF